MSRIHNPHHPGAMLREDILPSLGLSITVAANQLGLENGGRADAWMAQQAAYDLWQARAEGSPKINPHAKLLAA